ncbi:bifunctional tRNA (5-methylaminomethyl-2-thiouridine)(34)-methyltransferase MnmD/FAD-dependent 5-carboxymethylaminomethyl-2-thiouridine(34) oxidoreductase MnmC, partial [Pseudomonas syringae pv. tagetis]
MDWDEQGNPRSRDITDVYFSTESGLDETRHVFLVQNDLRRRFTELSEGGRLINGETGFGTGLNILCAWQLIQECAP